MLFNAQDILGVSCDVVVDYMNGDQALHQALQELHHPTQSSSASLAAATVPPDSYSSLTQAFTLGATVEMWLKLRIIEGLLRSLIFPVEANPYIII